MIEYKRLMYDHPPSPRFLEEEARVGWELVQVLILGVDFLWYFQREVDDESLDKGD